MKRAHIAVFMLTVLLFATMTNAADRLLKFPDSEKQQRFTNLIEELRCLVCQNQSLADSNADLAHDLRKEVYDRIVAGQSNEEIIDYLVERYGDFVLYRPPLKPSTYFLWFSPLIFLLTGGLIAFLIFKNQSGRKLSMEDKQYAEQLLELDNNRENNP